MSSRFLNRKQTSHNEETDKQKKERVVREGGGRRASFFSLALRKNKEKENRRHMVACGRHTQAKKKGAPVVQFSHSIVKEGRRA